MGSTRSEVILFMLLAAILIALEVISAILAYETVGAITSYLYFVAIALNIVLLVVSVRSRLVAALGMSVLALALVPYQFMLAQRMTRVQAEAARIVAYAYETKLSNGEFPIGFADYVPHDPDAQKFIQEFRRDPSQGGFVLCYQIGTESTSHCYSPRSGWTYYPD